ncbi:unnamed protein product, partial [Heterotrigona itama]
MEHLQNQEDHRPQTKRKRLNGKLHILQHCEDVKRKDCSVCSNRKINGERRQTNYFCDTCSRKPGLHIGRTIKYNFYIKLKHIIVWPVCWGCMNEKYECDVRRTALALSAFLLEKGEIRA